MDDKPVIGNMAYRTAVEAEFQSLRIGVNSKTHSSMPCVTGLTHHQLNVARFLASKERQMLRNEYTLLERLSGRAFTHEACAPGISAHCKSHTSDLSAFEQCDCKGQHVLIDVTHHQLPHYLLQFIQQFESSPMDTTACVLVPEHTLRKVTPLLKGWQHLVTYDRGTELYFHKDQRAIKGIPWKTQVWYRPPLVTAEVPQPDPATSPGGDGIDGSSQYATQMELDPPLESEFEPAVHTPQLTFVFSTKVAGLASTTLIDSGGTTEFISRMLVDKLGMSTKPNEHPTALVLL
jgi:hypothetical protein